MTIHKEHPHKSETLTKADLDHYANENNPNSDTYRAKMDNLEASAHGKKLDPKPGQYKNGNHQ